MYTYTVVLWILLHGEWQELATSSFDSLAECNAAVLHLAKQDKLPINSAASCREELVL